MSDFDKIRMPTHLVAAAARGASGGSPLTIHEWAAISKFQAAEVSRYAAEVKRLEKANEQATESLKSAMMMVAALVIQAGGPLRQVRLRKEIFLQLGVSESLITETDPATGDCILSIQKGTSQ
jgi:hypothetical protein